MRVEITVTLCLLNLWPTQVFVGLICRSESGILLKNFVVKYLIIKFDIAFSKVKKHSIRQFRSLSVPELNFYLNRMNY